MEFSLDRQRQTRQKPALVVHFNEQTLNAYESTQNFFRRYCAAGLYRHAEFGRAADARAFSREKRSNRDQRSRFFRWLRRALSKDLASRSHSRKIQAAYRRLDFDRGKMRNLFGLAYQASHSPRREQE